MDRMLYVAMTGAKETLRAQTVNNHNLANVSTTGFRADLAAFQSRAVDGTGFASRVYATNASVGWDDTSGALLTTGRDLDVAINGPGWIAVQAADGREAYTRAGNLQIDPTGQLKTATGQPVMGDGGPINVPPYTSIFFARDGSISIVAQGQTPDTTSTVGRIKLVNPAETDLVRGDDGLFRVRTGAAAEVDPKVKLQGGALEGSNVNVVEAMVNMISISRQFDMHMKILQNAEGNERQASQLLSMNR